MMGMIRTEKTIYAWYASFYQLRMQLEKNHFFSNNFRAHVLYLHEYKIFYIRVMLFLGHTDPTSCLPTVQIAVFLLSCSEHTIHCITRILYLVKTIPKNKRKACKNNRRNSSKTWRKLLLCVSLDQDLMLCSRCLKDTSIQAVHKGSFCHPTSQIS